MSETMEHLAEVRAFQRSRWGDEHDDEHTLHDWVTILAKYQGRIADRALAAVAHEGERFTPEEWRSLREQQALPALLDLAATALAAYEAVERRLRRLSPRSGVWGPFSGPGS